MSKNRFGILQKTTGRRGAQAGTKADLGSSRRTTDRRGAVASTEQTWDPPERQQIDVAQKQAQNRFGILQKDNR